MLDINIFKCFGMIKLYNQKPIVEYSKRFSERIKSSRVNLDELKYNGRFTELYSLFFDQRSFYNFYPGDNLYLEGTNPLTSSDFVYYALNKTTFRNEPWYIIIDQVSDFFELYNVKIQDRHAFVATSKTIKVEDYVIPLFLVFFCFRNTFSKIMPSLYIHDGTIVFRFEAIASSALSMFSITQSDVYDFLINTLKLEDKQLVNHILLDELNISFNQSIIMIKKQLYPVKANSKKERIIKYIKAKKIVTAQELADYFNVSKRMINYYIADLIDEEIIIRIGEVNASNTKYRINIDKYYF